MTDTRIRTARDLLVHVRLEEIPIAQTDHHHHDVAHPLDVALLPDADSPLQTRTRLEVDRHVRAVARQLLEEDREALGATTIGEQDLDRRPGEDSRLAVITSGMKGRAPLAGMHMIHTRARLGHEKGHHLPGFVTPHLLGVVVAVRPCDRTATMSLDHA